MSTNVHGYVTYHKINIWNTSIISESSLMSLSSKFPTGETISIFNVYYCFWDPCIWNISSCTLSCLASLAQHDICMFDLCFLHASDVGTFYHRIGFHCSYITCVYSFFCCWAFEWFPLLGYYELRWYEHSNTSIL